MKDKWRNYALKDGKVKESYIREYSNRSKSRKAAEASRSNSLQQSWEEQEEVKLVFQDPAYYKVNPVILNDAWVVNLRNIDESSREEEHSKTHQEGRQGVQGSDQGRCEAQETNTGKQREEVMKKQSVKERKHEATETKAFEKKESKLKKKEKVATAGKKRG
jgi:hypothetical protein